jgi:hypothetical protein
MPVLVREFCVASLALLSAVWPSDAILMALVVSLIVWPASLLVPMSWRGEITPETSMRYSSMFLLGILGLFVGSFGASRGPSFPTAALVLGFGALWMGALWVGLGPAKADLRSATPWVGGSMFGIAGLLSDLPHPAGWATLSFFLYGLVSSLTMLRVTSRAVEEGAASSNGLPD